MTSSRQRSPANPLKRTTRKSAGRRGVILSDRWSSLVELRIHEGRNRIVRRLLEQVGHPVRRLTRSAIGPVLLVGLRAGELRELTPDELGVLLDAADL